MQKIICVRLSRSKFYSLFTDRDKLVTFITKYRKLRFMENAYIKVIMKGTHEEPVLPFNKI